MKIIITAILLIILVFLYNKMLLKENINDNEYNYKEYNYNIFNDMKLRLIYQNGILQDIKHFRNKDLANNNYTFFEDGSISSVKLVIGDTIQKYITYYQSGQVESISFDLDLNPNDRIFKFHGIDKSFYESGSLRQLSKWNRGIMIDTFYLYSESGCLKQFGIYDKNGDCVCFTNYKCIDDLSE